MSAHPHHPPRSRAAGKTEPDHEIWTRILAHLRATHPQICRQWFEEIEPLGVAGGVLRLRAHTPMHRDYLHRQCSAAFNEAAREATGRLISIRFLGPEDELTEPRATPIASNGVNGSHGPSEGHGDHGANGVHGANGGAKAATVPHAAPSGLAAEAGPASFAAPISASLDAPVVPAAPAHASNGLPHAATGTPVPREQGSASVAAASDAPPADVPPAVDALAVSIVEPLLHAYDDGLILNPDYAFDNFVVGPGNRLAHAAASAVAATPGRAYNPFFVHAEVGLGKTHLLQAICLTIRQQKPGAVIYYTSCEGFMTQFMDAVAAGHLTRFRHKFRHVDVLVIDDIHFLAKRDRTQEEFFHTFNSLYQSHKQIVLSSDAAPEEIPELEDRLVSRFKWGLVTSLDAPCYETRVAILKSKAKIRGIDLPEDVACYIAGKIDSNIRELEGAIVKLHITSTVDKRPIDINLARTALGDDVTRAEPKIQLQTIINAVTDFFGVKVTDLQSKRRYRSIAQPRQLCMYLARKHTHFSLEQIGGYFGGRDHTTVMHAVKAVEDRRETDDELSAVIRTLEDKLRQPMAV